MLLHAAAMSRNGFLCTLSAHIVDTLVDGTVWTGWFNEFTSVYITRSDTQAGLITHWMRINSVHNNHWIVLPSMTKAKGNCRQGGEGKYFACWIQRFCVWRMSFWNLRPHLEPLSPVSTWLSMFTTDYETIRGTRGRTPSLPRYTRWLKVCEHLLLEHHSKIMAMNM